MAGSVWWMPDLSMVCAIVILVYCLFLFEGFQKLYRDSDAGWHIRSGEFVLDQKRLPAQDLFSFSKPAAPWFAWEWGADVIVGTLHRHGGLGVVALFFSLVIALTIWLWTRLHWAVDGSFLIAAALTPLVLTTSSLHWLARPHVLSWPLLLATFWVAESPPSRFLTRHAVTLVAAGCVWANLHASFFLAPVVGVLYAFGNWLGGQIWDDGPPRRTAQARWLLAASLCFTAGTLVNPYGWHLHQHLFGYLTDTELLSRVAEFQSFNFHADGAAQILLTLLLCMAGAVLAWTARRPGRCFATLLFLAIAVRSARGLPVAALVLLPLANGSLTTALTRARGLRFGLRRSLDAFLTYSANLRALDRRQGGYVWVPLALFACYWALGLPAIAAKTGFSPAEFPVAASEYVAKLPATARLLSTDKFGGYLIYRFAGSRKVYFDGRSDFYGSEFMKEYLSLIEMRGKWRETLARYAFTHALLPAGSPLEGALESSGWTPLYRDKVACLLTAPAQREEQRPGKY